uniref:L27 domain-containing protein n=1 Tax=Scophthalmus maximus TaxID=52904 RepID=A0A8D3CTG4_SCOMX
MLSRTEHRGVCRLLSSVMSGTESHADREEDYRFLHSMLMEKKLHLLFKIHERLKRFEKRSPIPVQEHAARLASDLVEELIYHGWRDEVKELVDLFSKPHFKSLLFVHDAVARRDFEPSLPPVPEDALVEDEDSVKIVSLVKTKEPLVSKHVLCVSKLNIFGSPLSFCLPRVNEEIDALSCLFFSVWETDSLDQSKYFHIEIQYMVIY